jgi:CubicO group peptidase (beta-lactamase class C family)
MDKSILDRFRISVMEQKLNVCGIVVHKMGEGTVTHRWSADIRDNIYSGAKTYTALAVGICQDEGRLNISDLVVDFFPEFKDKASEGFKNVTVRNLLQMASGLKAGIPYAKKNMHINFVEQILKTETDTAPGEQFYYNGSNTYLLSRIVEKVSGSNLRNYLVPRLFDIHGIHNPQWFTCSEGHTIAKSGLFLTTYEYSRLGITLINGGVYKDTRIVSEKFVHDMHNDIIDNNTGQFVDAESRAGYGYQVWRCCRKNTWCAVGIFGQFCIIAPDKNTTITVTTRPGLAMRTEHAQYDILRAVNDDILALL